MRCVCAAAIALTLCLPATAQRTRETRVEMIVYFPWNAQDFDSGGAQVIEAAAGRAKACRVIAVELVGHDDTSQGEERAQELSDLRALAVRQALIDAGIPARRIRTEGRGDRELEFNTADGVREQMNRRVEIAVRCAG